MKKYILAAALTAMLPVAAYAAATKAAVAAASMPESNPGDANLIGHVVDAETGDHLPYYTIKILDTEYITVTDATGHYTFTNLEPGRYKVEASSVGYTPQTLEVDIRLATTAELNFDVSADAFMLEQVVVTGSKSEQKRRNSPALVSVVSSKLFNLVNACSLADGLNFQPGVRVENDCQNCGFTQVRINGLDGHYSQILMNSRPVFSALAGVYGLEQIPANMIDRVEVMRGGGSALFGSSAIGGTVNIITRDPVSNSAEVSHTLMSIGI
ncbi:MAG: TonB-dependent receptor plug domain-containing protein, partial [Muribaculaceae bacterium]